MRKRWLGIVLAGVATATAAGAADPKTRATELTGWGVPSDADLLVLEALEGDNLAEARNAPKTKLEIVGTRKDLDGDGIPELFFFLKHPSFCYEELGGCTLLVVRRASLSDPWQEVGVITVPSPSVGITPGREGELPTLRPIGTQPYTWDGRAYKPEPGVAPAVPAGAH